MVIGLTIAVNYMLLLGVTRISGIGANKIRLLVASAFGGLYGGACMLGENSLYATVAGRIITLILISVIAFGIGRQLIRRCLIFLMLNMALDGMMELMDWTSGTSLALSAGTISFVCRFLRTSSALGNQFADIVIHHGGKSVKFEALRDTGNCLIDPVSGEKMMVIGPRTASAITGLTREELAAPVNTLRKGRIRGLWLVPFSSVGNANGLMLAMRFTDATLDGKRASFVAALAPEGMEEFDALIGG